jgi:competence protein ComEC
MVGGILFFLMIILSVLYFRYSVDKNNPKVINKINDNTITYASNATINNSIKKLIGKSLSYMKTDLEFTYILIVKQKLLQFIRKRRINKEDRFMLLLPIIILVGYVRMNAIIAPTSFDAYCERNCKASVVGEIMRITEKENSTSYYLDKIILYPSQDIQISIKQKIIAYGEKNSKFKVGNTVCFTGTVSQIMKATNEGQFDSYAYYLSEGIRYQMFAESMKCIDDSYSRYQMALATIRSKVSSVYRHILPSEEAGVMQAMFLGQKQALDTDIKNLYQRNGISHILSISGLHISFLGLLLYKILKKIGCPIYLNSGIVSIVVFSYGQMTDFSVSTNRAVVMMLVSLFAIVIGRTYDMLSAISLSSLIILIQNPMQLYNTGFQLSFLAVCVLAVFGDIYEMLKEGEKNREEIKRETNKRQITLHIEQFLFEKSLEIIKQSRKVVMKSDLTIKIYNKEYTGKKIQLKIDEWILSADEWIYKKYKLRESNRGKALQSSMIISAVMAPVLASTFCEIPIYSVIVNLFVIPLSSILMTLGVVAGLIGLWWIDFAKIFGYGITFILKFYEILCNIFSNLPFHLVLTGRPSMIQIIIYYAAVIGIILLAISTRRKKLIYIIAFMWILLFRLPSTNLTMTMLDISQGDCIYIKSPKGVSILVDGGSSDVKEIGKYRIEPFLKAQGVSRIDYVVLTHMDADHINGVMELMERMPDSEGDRNLKILELVSMAFYDGQVGIQNLILPETSFIDETYKKIEKLAVQKGIALHYFGRGDFIAEGELTITCLHPYLEYITDSTNDTSIVLDLTYRRFNALLLGDLESGGERKLINIAKEELLAANNLDGKQRTEEEAYRQQTVRKKHYDIIKIAHHGSKYSTSKEFLNYYGARIAWISSGYGNRYGHPHKELLERLKENNISYRWTVNEGAITIETDGKKIWE